MSRAKIEANCLKCQKPFSTRLSEIKRGNGKYCSRVCAYNVKKPKRQLNNEKHNCAHCSKELLLNPSRVKGSKSGLFFCSRACQDSLSYSIHNGSRKKNCKQCGGLFNKTNKEFCSLICRKDSLHNEFLAKWEAGEKISEGEGVSDRIREFLHKKYNSKCQKCGWGEVNPVTGKIPLTVNHIDGNWQNDLPSNLELICPNCHSITPNYGSLNKGNGRPSRRKK